MNKPKIGDVYHDKRLGTCRVVKVYIFGTMDVVNSQGDYFRVTGLSWVM